MKKFILLGLLNCFTFASFGQFPTSVDSLYTFIKSNSILRNSVDWKPIDENFLAQIKEAQTIQDTMNCFVSVLKSLNDVHSQIYLNNQYYGHYPTFDDTTLVWLKPLNEKAILLTNQIYTELLPHKIAYIRIPSIQVYDKQEINKYAQSLNDSISQYSQKKIKKFIVDLRLNGGGNIYPMLSGISFLLGDNVIGYETDINDNIVRSWKIVNGNFVIGEYQTTEIISKANIESQSMLIVVLIGPITKSSGSMTAIAFKKMPNTIFIGEPTANGYTTSNGYFQFAPNLMLNFATNFVADRELNIYKDSVNPDIMIYHGDNFDNLMADKKILSALKWLKKKN